MKPFNTYYNNNYDVGWINDLISRDRTRPRGWGTLLITFHSICLIVGLLCAATVTTTQVTWLDQYFVLFAYFNYCAIAVIRFYFYYRVARWKCVGYNSCTQQYEWEPRWRVESRIGIISFICLIFCVVSAWYYDLNDMEDHFQISLCCAYVSALFCCVVYVDISTALDHSNWPRWLRPIILFLRGIWTIWICLFMFHISGYELIYSRFYLFVACIFELVIWHLVADYRHPLKPRRFYYASLAVGFRLMCIVAGLWCLASAFTYYLLEDSGTDLNFRLWLTSLVCTLFWAMGWLCASIYYSDLPKPIPVDHSISISAILRFALKLGLLFCLYALWNAPLSTSIASVDSIPRVIWVIIAAICYLFHRDLGLYCIIKVKPTREEIIVRCIRVGFHFSLWSWGVFNFPFERGVWDHPWVWVWLLVPFVLYIQLWRYNSIFLYSPQLPSKFSSNLRILVTFAATICWTVACILFWAALARKSDDTALAALGWFLRAYLFYATRRFIELYYLYDVETEGLSLKWPYVLRLISIFCLAMFTLLTVMCALSVQDPVDTVAITVLVSCACIANMIRQCVDYYYEDLPTLRYKTRLDRFVYLFIKLLLSLSLAGGVICAAFGSMDDEYGALSIVLLLLAQVFFAFQQILDEDLFDDRRPFG